MKLKEYCIKEGKLYLLDEWDTKKNYPHTPETVNHSSCITVWWRCEKGHSWHTQLKSRSTSLTRCPKCREKELTKRKNKL